jgi:F-type H+-transporting ATPase subunit epsilon
MTLVTIKIITPERKVYEKNDVSSASFPTPDGQITILPNHIPLVTKITHGEVIIRFAGKEDSLITTDGFLKLDSKGNILLLADYAIRSDEIELAKSEEAKKRAEAMLKEKKTGREFAIAEAELRRTLLELNIAKKRKTKQPKI